MCKVGGCSALFYRSSALYSTCIWLVYAFFCFLIPLKALDLCPLRPLEYRFLLRAYERAFPLTLARTERSAGVRAFSNSNTHE
jgi:hypothetical protein